MPLNMKPIPPNPKLDALLEKARAHEMTRAEKAEQRRSFVRGNMPLDRPDLTDEEMDRRDMEEGRATPDELRLLDALRSGEMVAVPREMTDEMAEAMLEASGSTPADYWRAALAAAPEREKSR